MGELQEFFTQLVYNVSLIIPLGYAFGAGMVSTVNPCGFAMLPAYLGLYLGSRDLTAPRLAAVTPSGTAEITVSVPAQFVRAITVTAVVKAGFVVLFGVTGLLITAGGRLIITLVPWVALAIGGILALLGIAMLAGRQVIRANFAVRLASRLGDPGTVSVRSFFIFGFAYAAASLSCTLPVFLTVVGGSLAVSGFAAASLQFVSYGLGMGLVILVLTLGIGVFKGATVSQFRSLLPYVERVSAFLMVIAGGYIVYYWLIKGGLIDVFI